MGVRLQVLLGVEPGGDSSVSIEKHSGKSVVQMPSSVSLALLSQVDDQLSMLAIDF